MAPFAIGTALMAMAFAGGHRSGGHYNPAVSLGVWMRGSLSTSDLAPYIASQIMGGIAAAIVVGLMKGDVQIVAATPDVAKALMAETLGTFALVYVVLNTATDKDLAGNSFLLQTFSRCQRAMHQFAASNDRQTLSWPDDGGLTERNQMFARRHRSFAVGLARVVGDTDQ